MTTFKNDKNTNLLFINDISLIVGLDIEFASFLIIFSFLNMSNRDQLIGRVLRYNRIGNLYIYQLYYTNEM